MVHLALTILFVAQPVKKPAPLPKPPAIVQVIAPIPELSYAPYPYSPVGTFNNGFDVGQCTSYVASRKQVPDSFGNANNWAAAAEADGIPVSDIPIVGTIAQTSRGTYGHVGLVLDVQGDQVLIAEQNYDFMGSIREAWHSVSEFQYIWM